MARNYEKRFSGLNRFLEAKEKGEHYKPSLHHHFSMFNSFHRGWEVRKPEATVGGYYVRMLMMSSVRCIQ